MILCDFKIKGYSFIDFEMEECFKENVRDYINKNYNKTIFEFENNLYDIESLNALVNLDCLNCRSAHNTLCCGGQPFTPKNEDISKVEKEISNISKFISNEYKNENSTNIIEKDGFLDEKNNFKNNCNRCIFSIPTSTSDICGIHAYALENKINPATIKPKSCLMYPLDMIELESGNHFIFAVNESTVIKTNKVNNELHVAKGNTGFSRWNNTDLDFVCVNKKLRENIITKKEFQSEFAKATLPEHMFKVEEYKPVYKEEKNILITFFGEKSFDFIDQKSKKISP